MYDFICGEAQGLFTFFVGSAALLIASFTFRIILLH